MQDLSSHWQNCIRLQIVVLLINVYITNSYINTSVICNVSFQSQDQLKPNCLKVVESDYMADRHDCQWSMGDWHDGR